MNSKHQVLFLTHRGERHQQAAISSAPLELDITIRRSPLKEEILALLPEKEFLITERSGEIDADIISAGKDLRLIQRLGSMSYDIDLQSAKSHGIEVSRLPVESCIMVAEHMLMQMLASAKRLREMMEITRQAEKHGSTPQLCDEDYFAYNWADCKDIRGLWGSTVGILGFGEIGAEVARRLKGFGCTILYNKRNPLPLLAEEELQIHYADIDDLLASSDFVCMLLPYFPETNQSLNDQFFKKMKLGAIFVSCGGSGVVDEEALANALISRQLYGAAVDTYTYEPIAKDNPLLPFLDDKNFNLFLTPHTAAGSGSSSSANKGERYGDYSNILRVIHGEPIVGRIA